MAFDLDQVRLTAALARLDLEAAEEEALATQLASIVDYFDQLNRFETAERDDESLGSGVEAEDRPGEQLGRELFLGNAPEHRDGFLVVPRVKDDV